MNYGRFFALDENSRLDKGITVFNYLWLTDEKNTTGKKTPKYPIYVAITKEAINFYSHYYYENDKIGGDKRERHQHSLILSLPLSENLDVKDGLTSALVEAYKTKYPVRDNGGACNYQLELLIDTVFSKECDLEKDNTSYWNLDVFGIKNAVKQTKADALLSKSKSIFDRLILIIQSNKNISKAKQKRKIKQVQNNYNNKIKELQTDIDIYISESNFDILRKYKEQLFWLEEKDATLSFSKLISNHHNFIKINWFIRKLILDFLFDLEHTKVFQNCPYYEHLSIRLRENFFFNALANKANYYYYREIVKDGINSKNEKDKKYFSKLILFQGQLTKIEEIWTATIRNPKSDHFFTIAQNPGWFEDPEEELEKIYVRSCRGEKRWNRINIFKEINSKKISENTNIGNQASSPSISNNIRNVKKRLQLTAKTDSKWFLQKFDFKNVFFNKYVFVAILSSIIILCLFEILSVHSKWLLNGLKYVVILSFSLVLIPSIILLVFSMFKKRRSKKITSWKVFINAVGIHVFLPRLIAAIIAVWITFSFSEDLFRAFFDIDINFPIAIILPLLVIIFTFNELSRYIPYVGWWKRLGRSSIFVLIAFFYSFNIGLIITGVTGAKFLERSGFVKEFYENHVLVDNSEYTIVRNPNEFVINSFYHDILLKHDTAFADSIIELTNKIMDDSICISKADVFGKDCVIKMDTSKWSGIKGAHSNCDCFQRWKNCKIESRFTSHENVFAALVLNIVDSLIFNMDYAYYTDSQCHICENDFKKNISNLKNVYSPSSYLSKDSTERQSFFYHIVSDTSKNISRWKRYIEVADNDIVYKESIKYLAVKKRNGKHGPSILQEVDFCGLKFNILPNFLLQFTFIAMFIGIFIQLIFEQRKITESD